MTSLIARSSLAALTLATLGALGCGSTTGESTPSATVSAIALSPNPCGVTRTNSVQMTAQATLTDGEKMDITHLAGSKWSTGNTDTATVDSGGLVVGVNSGVTGVTVEYMGASGKLDCTVAP